MWQEEVYNGNYPEQLRRCIFYHRDTLEHPGTSVFKEYNSTIQKQIYNFQ